MHSILLGVAAMVGTIVGLFVGIPVVGYILWPLTRAIRRLMPHEIDDEQLDDRVSRIEGSLTTGLGMALGVLSTVAGVGWAIEAHRFFAAASVAAALAGLTFGWLWSWAYRQNSATPVLLLTALFSALGAGVTGG